jgi:hypothetical protein
MTISHKSGVAPKMSNTMLEEKHKSEVIKNKIIKLRSRFFLFGVGEIEDIDSALKNYKE